jgi:hypothetical protein
MGFFSDLKDIFGSTTDFAVSIGEETLTAVVDFENWTVNLAGETWNAIPGEFIAPGLGPLAGILKNELEDELFMLAGPSGLAVGFGVFPVQFDQAAQFIIGGLALIGAIKHRELNDEEWEMATWVFGDELPPRGSIRLTNLGVPRHPLDDLFSRDRPITFPAIGNKYYINLGPKYRHRSSIADGPTLLHELTHVWQGRNKLIRDVQILVAAKDRDYDYSLGSQWRDYGLEQQAAIVKDWALGTVEHNKPATLHGKPFNLTPFSLSSPLFRYIHANVRKNDNRAHSSRVTSVRRLAAPFPPGKDLRLSKLHPPAPHRWWNT